MFVWPLVHAVLISLPRMKWNPSDQVAQAASISKEVNPPQWGTLQLMRRQLRKQEKLQSCLDDLPNWSSPAVCKQAALL